MSPRRTRYSLREIRRLVDGYEAILARRDTTEFGIRAIVAVLDIRAGIRTLPQGLRAVLLLHGVLGLSALDTSRALKISERAVRQRYTAALAHLEWRLNGGSY